MNYLPIKLLSVLFAIFLACSAFAGPGVTTYQAKIIKPDGLPLEANSVNFKFTILNPIGTCILYSETYSSVNMAATGGLVSFPLGSGVKIYPVSATTFAEVFSNVTPNLSCDVGGPGTFTPGASDTRKIVMQFHDGGGWQTLPAMSINAVPYAMYANEAQKISGLPTCNSGEALSYNGVTFSCEVIGGGGAVTSSTVIAALGYTPASSATLASLVSSVANDSANISSVSATVYSVSTTVTSLQNSVAASFAAMTSFSSLDLGSASATGILAEARLPSFANITSGTQYTKVTVDGKGRVTSGSQLSALDISAAVGADSLIKIGIFDGYSMNVYAGNGVGNIGTATGTSNEAFGHGGLRFLTSGNRNVAMGIYALGNVTTGSSNIGIGQEAGLVITTGSNNIAIGNGSSVPNGTGSNQLSINNLIYGISSNVGIGTSAPVTTLDVSGGVRISMESAACAVSYAGTLRYNAGTVEYCNGTAWSAFGVSGAGLQSLNGSTSGTQSFAIGAGGTAPGISTDNGVHAFSIPYAASSTVTGGLLSNTDYTAFTNKLDATSAAVISALAYTPASASSVANLTSSMTTLNSTVLSLSSSVGDFKADGSVSMTGTFKSLAGDNTTPGITFAGDTNTGIYQIGDGRIGISGNGALTLDISGNDTVFTGIMRGNNVGAARMTSTNPQNALTPAYGFSLSTTTGMFNPAVNQLAFTTSGSERIRIDGYGNVGIGTSNPTTRLDVNGQAQFKNANTQIILRDTDEVAGEFAYIERNNTALMFGTNNGSSSTIGMTIKDGNIGIGTAAPTARLHLAAGSATQAVFKLTSGTLLTSPASGAVEYDGTNLYFTDEANTRRTLATITNSTGDFKADGSVSMTGQFKAISGNLVTPGIIFANDPDTGFATTAPNTMFFVTGGLGTWLVTSTSLGTNAAGPTLRTANTQASPSIGWTFDGDTGFFNPSANTIAITTSGTEKMRVDSAGNVGIGTTLATAKLHLGAGTAATASFKFSSGTLTTSPQSGTIEYDGAEFYLTDGAGVRRMIAAGASAGSIDDASFINSTGNITMTPVGSVVVSSTTASTNSQTGALIVKGGLGVAENIYSSGTIITSSNIQGVSVTATSGMITPYVYGSTLSGGNLILDSTTHTSKGNILLAANGGNVGIGTPAPTTKFEVSDNAGRSVRLSPTGYSGDYNNLPLIHLENTNNVSDDWLLVNNNDKFHISTEASSGSEKLTVTAVGNVGIGTSAPTTYLDISGNGGETLILRDKDSLFTDNAFALYIRGKDSANNNVWYVGEGSGSAKNVSLMAYQAGYPLTFATSSAERMRIDDTGNVGIGTTSPGTILDVQAADSYASIETKRADNSSQPLLLLKRTRSDATNPSAGFGAGLYFQLEGFSGMTFNTGSIQSQWEVSQTNSTTDVDSNLIFSVNQNNSELERMRITSNGNVGIGVTAPNALLQIGPDGPTSSAYLTYAGSYLSSAGQAQYAGNWASTGYWGIGPATNASNSTIRIGNIDSAAGTWSATQNLNLTIGGKMGIGTSAPASILHLANVAPYVTFEETDTTQKFFAGVDGSGYWMRQGTTANPDLITIKNTGNVGIGATAPSEKLHVLGNLRVQGSTDCTLGNGAGGTNCSSDIRLKENIKPIPYALEKINSLKGVEFDWNQKSLSYGRHDIGVIAQDVEKAFPTAVITDKATGYKKVDYAVLVAPIIQAFKELYNLVMGEKAHNEKQDRLIAALTLENERKDKELREMKERLDRIEKQLRR